MKNNSIVITIKNNKIELFENGKFLFAKKNGTWIKTNKKIYLFSGKQIFYFDINDKCRLNKLINNNPLSNKFFVIIITCYRNISKINKLRKLWIKDLKELNIRYLFIIGNGLNKDSYIQGDILYTKCKDDYESLPQKIYKALEFVNKNFKFDYIFKIDDDCILNPLTLFTINTKNDLYIGKTKMVDKTFNKYWHKGKCKNNLLNNIPYPQSRIYLNTNHAKGESGYFLHYSIIPIILNYKNYIFSDIYEDKVIGDVLRFNNILLTDKLNYKSKLFEKSLLSSISGKYSIIVDVPEIYLNDLYVKSKIKI